MAVPVLEIYHAGCRVNSEFYLRDISLQLAPGEAVAIMGRNASGKSTLCAMLTGQYSLTGGEILMDGQKVSIRCPQDAILHGILLLGQNQPMFENLQVYQNIYFGHELMKGGKILDNSGMCRETAQLLAKLDISVAPQARMSELTHAQRQLVSLARAVCIGAKLVLLDEPSTHLGAIEKQNLWNAVRAMKQEGKGVLLITHDPFEALAVADRVGFMQDGVLEEVAPANQFQADTLAHKAYDIAAERLYARERSEPGEAVLEIAIPGIGAALRRGEVTAVLGDPQIAEYLLARIAGLASGEGTVKVNGVEIAPTPLSGVANGVSLALDDESEELITQARELVDNGGQNNLKTRMLYRMKQLGSGLSGTFGPWVGIKSQGEYVTGGNRRRELMERALGRRAAVYLLMDPSAGMDLPSRMRLYERLGTAAKEGAAVLFVTGNPAEAFGLADRILVIREDGIVLDTPATEAAKEQVFAKLKAAKSAKSVNP